MPFERYLQNTSFHLRFPIRILEQFAADRAGNPPGLTFVRPFVLAVRTWAGCHGPPHLIFPNLIFLKPT